MSADTKTKTCKECKTEKDVSSFAINRRVGNKTYYKAYCKECWCTKQKNKYIKRYDNGLNRRGYITENKPELLNKIMNMRMDGENWNNISNDVGVSKPHLYSMCSKGLIPVK